MRHAEKNTASQLHLSCQPPTPALTAVFERLRVPVSSGLNRLTAEAYFRLRSLLLQMLCDWRNVPKHCEPLPEPTDYLPCIVQRVSSSHFKTSPQAVYPLARHMSWLSAQYQHDQEASTQ